MPKGGCLLAPSLPFDRVLLIHSITDHFGTIQSQRRRDKVCWGMSHWSLYFL
jgi:hypothetical protein